MVLAVTIEFAFTVWSAARLQDSGLTVSAAAAAAAAFPLGMAAGRLAAARLLGRIPVVPLSALLVLVAAATAMSPAGPLACVGALAVAGLGVAALHPVTLSELMGVPGLAERHAAALGATASGTAILAGPSLIGAVAGAATLRTAFPVVIPLVPALLLLRVIADHPPRYWRNSVRRGRVGSSAGDQARPHRVATLAAGGEEGVEHAHGAGKRHRDLLRDPGRG